MMPDLNRIKGVHPGAVLKRELKKREIKCIDLANDINEHSQTLNAITKERRGINPKLSYKLGEYFNISSDYFMILQATYEVETYKVLANQKVNPLVGKFRVSLFWDTKFELIDHKENKRFIIKRILERGNEVEIKNLIQIYTLPVIKNELQSIGNSFVPNFKWNINKYIKDEI